MGHGAIVPRGCLLWNWVANVVTELTYPDPRLNRPEPTHEGYHCYAASALLEEVRPREPREVRCVALTAVSGNMYLVARDDGPDVPPEAAGRQLTCTRLSRPMRDAAPGQRCQHLTLLCGTLVSEGDEGLTFSAEDLVAWRGRTMVRRAPSMRVATLEAQLVPLWEQELQQEQDGNCAVRLRHRAKPHRADWAFCTPGAVEYVDDAGLELAGAVDRASYPRTTFQREFTMCFWIKVSAAGTGCTLLERGDASIGACPAVFLDDDLRLGVRANVDPGPECVVRSSQPLAADAWTHVTFSVQQSQRSVELLLNGEVSHRAEMSEGGKLFTDGGGMPLVMGAFGADGTCCISHLHVYPTCSLSRGSAKQVYQAQRSMLGEKVEPEVPLGVPSTITALGPSASLRQRLETICSSDARAGWPASKPGVGVSHDTTWCLAQHQMTLAHHLSESTRCVVELGAWLGKFALTRCDVAHSDQRLWIHQATPRGSSRSTRRTLLCLPSTSGPTTRCYWTRITTARSTSECSRALPSTIRSLRTLGSCVEAWTRIKWPASFLSTCRQPKPSDGCTRPACRRISSTWTQPGTTSRSLPTSPTADASSRMLASAERRGNAHWLRARCVRSPGALATAVCTRRTARRGSWVRWTRTRRW